MTEKKKSSPEAIVREIKPNTRSKFSSEEKIRIVLEGLRGEESINTICRREGINSHSIPPKKESDPIDATPS
jgi:transposase